MAFKKARKSLSNYIGSVSGDTNSFADKISGRLGSLSNISNSFDQRISDGLSDLLTGATGIRTSNIPAISKEVMEMKGTNREARASVLNGAGRENPQDAPPQFKKMQFPTDWRTENNESGNLQNYIHFRSLKRKNTEAGEVNYDIFLYVPTDMTDAVSVSYAEGEKSIADAVVSKMFGGAGGIADMSEIKQIMLDNVDAGKILKAAAGKTVNPMKFQMFSGVDMRTYSYSFELYPETQSDSEVIREIAYAFKKSALPGTTGANKRIYTFPNEWAIRYHGPMKNWIDYPMVSVLTGVDVNYGLNGSQRMIDGAPSGVGISLSFSEVVTLDRDKFDSRVAAFTNKTGTAREQTQEGGSDKDIQGIAASAVDDASQAEAITAAAGAAEAKAAEDNT